MNQLPPHALFGGAVLAVVFYVFFKLRRLLSRYSYMDGPPLEHWLYGSMCPRPGVDPLAHYGLSFAKWGPTFKERGLVGIPHAVTIDPRAANHIFAKSDIYLKPEFTNWILGMVTGDSGLLVVEGEQHKRIRRIVAPSFALVHIKALVPTFVEKAQQLVQLIDLHLTNTPDKEVDMKLYSAKCTFDIIGAAGFGTDLGCMDPSGKSSELVQAIDASSDSLADDQSLFTALQALFPILRGIPSKQSRVIRRATETMERIGQDIVNQKRGEILSHSVGDEKVTKEDVGGKDLLSVILRASLADDVPDNQKLSDEELFAQVITFILAGFETSSTSVTLTLEALCDDTTVQDKLRKELLAVETDNPTYDELNDLPYLDAVVKESLRLFPPAAATPRMLAQDDMLPLAVPVKNTRTGEMMTELPVKKGELIFIITQMMNNSPLFWGEDAGSFNPDRWLSPLPTNPGQDSLTPFWSSMGSFHSGPRACIGMRFALIEIKALLFTLLRAFHFQHLDPKPEIYHALAIVARPMIKGRENEGGMLPLRVGRVGR